MSFISELVGGSIGFLGDMIAPFISNRQNRGAQDDAQRYEEHMWHLNNEYNKPTEQIRRLKEAGLNPHLAFGSPTAAGNATLGGGAGTPGGAGGNLNFSNTVRLMEIFEDLKNKKAQTEVMKAEKKLKEDMSEETKEKVKNLAKSTQLLEADRQLKLGSKLLQDLDVQKSYIPKKLYGTGNALFDFFSKRDTKENKKRLQELDSYFSNLQKEFDNSPKHSDREFLRSSWKKFKSKLFNK